MSGITQDQDGITRSGETIREAKKRGGRNQPSKGKNKQAYGGMTTPSGTSWLQVRSDWLTGAFTERGLADAHGVPIATLRSRMHKKSDPWGPRPLQHSISRALPGLVDALPDGGGSASMDTIEAITAQIEGRAVDSDAVHVERASSAAQRKAAILRNHRDMANAYTKLANLSVKLLTDYAEGSLPCSYVKSTDADGKLIHLPFYLLSKQHGLMDGVDKVGSIVSKAVNLQRLAHGLEDVDGDGNQRKPGAGAVNQYANLTDDELATKLSQLTESLSAPRRLTPVPPVLAADHA